MMELITADVRLENQINNYLGAASTIFIMRMNDVFFRRISTGRFLGTNRQHFISTFYLEGGWGGAR